MGAVAPFKCLGRPGSFPGSGLGPGASPRANPKARNFQKIIFWISLELGGITKDFRLHCAPEFVISDSKLFRPDTRWIVFRHFILIFHKSCRDIASLALAGVPVVSSLGLVWSRPIGASLPALPLSDAARHDRQPTCPSACHTYQAQPG